MFGEHHGTFYDMYRAKYKHQPWKPQTLKALTARKRLSPAALKPQTLKAHNPNCTLSSGNSRQNTSSPGPKPTNPSAINGSEHFRGLCVFKSGSTARGLGI